MAAFFCRHIDGCCFTGVPAFLIPARPLLTVLIALILVLAISYGFEVASKITRRGVYDVMDAVASVIGGIVGMLIPILFKLHLFYI